MSLCQPGGCRLFPSVPKHCATTRALSFKTGGPNGLRESEEKPAKRRPTAAAEPGPRQESSSRETRQGQSGRCPCRAREGSRTRLTRELRASLSAREPPSRFVLTIATSFADRVLCRFRCLSWTPIVVFITESRESQRRPGQFPPLSVAMGNLLRHRWSSGEAAEGRSLFSLE